MPLQYSDTDYIPRRKRLPIGVRDSLDFLHEQRIPTNATVPAYALTAVNCPAVLEGISSTLLTLANAVSGDGNAPSGRGMTRRVDWRQSVYNKNLLAAELMGRYGGGGAYFVAKGLTLYNAGGLSLGINAGHAVMSTVIEYAGGTVAVSDTLSGTPSRIWIWLSSTGTISTVVTSLTPPAGQQVLIGSCLTSGGTIPAIDTSGVLYARGNKLVRYVADVAVPTDVPSNLVRYINRNPWTFQEWEWTGGEYITVPSAYNPLPVTAGGTGTVSGTASPEGVITATVGSVYLETTTPAVYMKETGSGATGWVKKWDINGYYAPSLSADPASPVNGQIWYNTSSNQLMRRANGLSGAL